MSRVLVVSQEPVGERIAGPAIRALELSRALAAECEVTLAAPAPSAAEGEPFALLEAGLADFDALFEAARGHDVVVAQRLPAQLLRRVRKLPVRFVADLYNPIVVEGLEAASREPEPGATASVRQTALTVMAQCAAADFVICASEKQRDLWLGGMALAGLVDLRAYRHDPTYRQFVDVVPFGVPSEAPQAAERPLKGVWPGIGADDEVLLWGGGIWRWLDALTPIRAVERLNDRGRDVHLFFLGVDRPSAAPDRVPSAAVAAIEFARERGLEGTRVHFKEGWTPYAERAGYLLDADLGVSAHHDHLEARFSFRTRVLDYVWAGLPVVTTGGDSVAELVERERLGETVAPGDDEGFAAACERLLDRPPPPGDAADALRWPVAARPLIDFCLDPSRPVPRKYGAALALATYGQYPFIAARRGEAEGPGAVVRSAGRWASRAVGRRL
jgi:glycosyltransferase involved in cell wall biosynthesis